jgi:hypothetical protein
MLGSFFKGETMKLNHLSDQTLIQETERLARAETEILTSVLHHLREIDRRRLYSALGFPSLFAYASEKLGYAADQAYRRIAAMRLLAEIPEMEEKIANGNLNLTTVSLARTAFRKRECTNEEKIEILESLEKKTTREAEKILSEFAPPPPQPDKVIHLGEEQIELRVRASAALQEKIGALKGLLAHKHPELSLGELFEKLCDLGLEAWSKEEKFAAPQMGKPDSQAGLRRAVFKRAQSQCENCGSKHALEVDHIVPRSLGGPHIPENLRLLCRPCNQRAAIEALGQEKMAPFLEKRRL